MSNGEPYRVDLKEIKRSLKINTFKNLGFGCAITQSNKI